MKSWIIERTEQVLETIFMSLDLRDDYYVYLSRAIQEKSKILCHVKKEELGSSISGSPFGEILADYADIPTTEVVFGYINRFQLLHDQTPENLGELAVAILQDSFVLCIEAIEQAYQWKEATRRS